MHNIVLNNMNTLNHYLMCLVGLALKLSIFTLILGCLVAFDVVAQDENTDTASIDQMDTAEKGEDNTKAAVKEQGAIEDQKLLPRFQPNIDRSNKQRLMDAFLPENVNKYRVSGELVTLRSGQDDFLAVWEPSRHATPLGAVLLLHGEGQTLDSPQAISVVRSSLPDYGWATLSVSIDAPPANIIPSRMIKKMASKKNNLDDQKDSGDDKEADSNSEEVNERDNDINDAPINADTMVEDDNDGEGGNNMSAISPPLDAEALALLRREKDEAYSNDILMRLRAGLAFLNEKGQFNIAIVSHGTGGLYVKRLANQMSGVSKASGDITTTIRALIFINARNTSALGTFDMATLFIEDDYPILDIYFNHHVADQVEPKIRLKAAKQAKHQDYYQVPLKAPATQWHEGENRLTRRVRGFLNRFAKGVEIGGD